MMADFFGCGLGAMLNDFGASNDIVHNMRIIQRCEQICGQQQMLLAAVTNDIVQERDSVSAMERNDVPQSVCNPNYNGQMHIATADPVTSTTIPVATASRQGYYYSGSAAPHTYMSPEPQQNAFIGSGGSDGGGCLGGGTGSDAGFVEGVIMGDMMGIRTKNKS
jgi:hypothetical protein